MFCLCCPKKGSSSLQKNTIDEKLIEANYSPRKNHSPIKNLALSETNQKNRMTHLSQQSQSFSNIQKATYPNLNKLMSDPNSKDQSQFGIKPYFDQNFQSLKNSNVGIKVASKIKGQLFQFDHNTQIVYFDTKKGDQFCIRYIITKKPLIQKQTKSVLNLILAKKYQHQKDQQELVLIISSKLLYESKHMQIPPTTHAIFTNMKKPLKNNNGPIIQIVEGYQSCIKIDPFDKIIIMLESEQDIQYIKSYSYQLTRRYSLQQFMKIWWILPSFIKLEDITQIIKQTLRKFIINQCIQNVSKYIEYQIDVIKQLNLEPFLLIKNKNWKDASYGTIKTISNLTSKDYQTEICLAIGLFLVEMNEMVLPYYKYFLQNQLYSMKFIDYLKYKELIQNQKENYFKKLLFYDLITQQAATIFYQNPKMIEHKYQNPHHRRFCIKHAEKKRFVTAFGFQQSIQTGESNTPLKNQWDDNLKLQDLQIRKYSFDKQPQTVQNDLNLIDQLDIDNLILNQIENVNIEQKQLHTDQQSIQATLKNEAQSQKMIKSRKQTQEIQINIEQTV